MPTPTSLYQPNQYNNQSYRERRISEIESNNNQDSQIDFITIGSTKRNVARIQGTPTSIRIINARMEVWEYNWSRINFYDGKVTEWNNISRNLKVKYVY
jgi:hypothetical protein